MIYSYKGFLNDKDKALAKFKPTDRQTIKPGPAVAATASISFNFILLIFKAFFVMMSILSRCALAAKSGTTPPHFLWISNWLETTFDKILGLFFPLSLNMETAVSSQLVSMPIIIVFFLIKGFY